MWTQFFLENLHFAVNIAAAFVFFAVFWLYFDAWLAKKSLRDTFKILGFLLLSLSFIFTATHIESTVLATPVLSSGIYSLLFSATRFLGYVFVITSLIADPLIPKPSRKGAKMGVVLLDGVFYIISVLTFTYPILAAFAGFLYLRRATVGLENHLKPVALTFFILSISELLSLGFLLQNTQNTSLYAFVAPFGILWLLQNAVLVLTFLVLQRWVFGYLLKRFQSQLFIIFTSSIVAIFLVTTVAFTTLLLKNLETDSLAHLETDVNILQYSIESKKAETLSDAQVVAQNPDVQKAITDGDKKKLKAFASSILLTKKQAILTIISKDGVVLARGDDPEKIGDSLSGETLVKRGLAGESVSTVLTKDGVIAPTVSIRSAAPINSGKDGVVIVGTDIDNAFVDGVKSATKLDVSIYADNIRSATTFVSPDGKSRWIGIKEENPQIKKQVIAGGKSFVGSVNILNTPFLAAFLPLKDMDNTTVGMLFVGQEQSSLLAAAGRAIELTFLVSVILLVLSIFPAFIVSRYISRQIR